MSEKSTNLRFSHPLHPSSVHFPIAFLLAGSGLTLAGFTALRVPGLAAPFTKLLSMTRHEVATSMCKVGHISNVAGLVSSFVALNSGIWEGYNIYRNRGLNLSDPVVTTTIYHAALNDIAIVASAFNWWSLRNNVSFIPTPTNAAVSAFIFAGVGLSGYLGGTLVYKYGIGVQRMGEGKDIKEAELREMKASAKAETRKEL